MNQGYALNTRREAQVLPNGGQVPPPPGGAKGNRMLAENFVLYQPCGEDLSKTLVLGCHNCLEELSCSMWVAKSVIKLFLGQVAPMLEQTATSQAKLINR